MRIFLLSGIFPLLVCSRHIQANTRPGRPINVTLLADDHNIAVSWEPPPNYNGIIQRYIITWAILPNFTDVSYRNLVDGNLTVSFIAIKEDLGRLFRVRVRAASESGIGEYSLPRYIRIGCGHNVTVDPKTHNTVISPGFNATLPLKSGVVCKWHILTRSIYSLTLSFSYMNLFTSDKKRNCDQMQTYINVSNVGLFCNAEDVGRDIITRQNSLTISLMTGLESGGRGFSLILSAEVKIPGSPVNITTRVTTHAIIVAWEPPVEETLPVTSYVIRYRVLPQGHAYRIVVRAIMRAFPVNTDKLEGKLFSFSVTATIRSLEGVASSKVYARASCQRAYYLQPGQSVNISSPNYPDAYPDSMVCVWTIQCSPETALRMTYFDFQLEDIPFCNSDYIMFSNKRERECARINVPFFLETGLQQINVTFVTDNVNQYRGFLINFAAEDFSGYRPGFPNTDITLLSTALADFSPKTRKLLNHHKSIPSSAVVYSPVTSAFTSLATQTSPLPSLSKSSSVVANSVSLHASSTANYSLEQPSSTLESFTLYPNVLVLASKSQVTFPRATPASQTAVSSSSPTPLDPVISLPVKTSHRKLSSNTAFVSEPSSSEVSVLSETESSLTSPFHPVTSDPANPFTIPLSEQLLSKTTSKFALHHFTKEDHKAGTTISSKGEGVTEKSSRERGHEETGADILVPVLLSTAGCVIVACVVVTVLCRRLRQRRKIKIEYQSGNRYRRNHIELHDILLESQNTLGKNVIFKTVSSQDMFGKLGSRKRRSTFPFSYSLRKRKVHEAIQREMRVFGSFIEDKDALEERLRRRHEHRRSSSF